MPRQLGSWRGFCGQRKRFGLFRSRSGRGPGCMIVQSEVRAFDPQTVVRQLPVFKMRPEYATAEDFAAWEARAKTMSIAALLYTIKDCQQAARGMRGWNPDKEGFYTDQACTYGMEYTRRKRGAA